MEHDLYEQLETIKHYLQIQISRTEETNHLLYRILNRNQETTNEEIDEETIIEAPTPPPELNTYKKNTTKIKRLK